MIDIHTHILPGLDDGARDMDEALRMIRHAWQRGTTELILTPHFAPAYGYNNSDIELLDQTFQKLCGIVYERERIPVILHPGMEVLYENHREFVNHMEHYFTLCGGEYFLMEYDFGVEEDRFLEGIQTALSYGQIPVIAHPERYACVQENPELVREGKRKGAWFQMNKGSLSGRHGERARRSAVRLMDLDLIDFVASDAHDSRIRHTGLDRVFRFIYEEYGQERAYRLLEENPRKITADREWESNRRRENAE